MIAEIWFACIVSYSLVMLHFVLSKWAYIMVHTLHSMGPKVWPFIKSYMLSLYLYSSHSWAVLFHCGWRRWICTSLHAFERRRPKLLVYRSVAIIFLGYPHSLSCIHAYVNSAIMMMLYERERVKKRQRELDEREWHHATSCQSDLLCSCLRSDRAGFHT